MSDQTATTIGERDHQRARDRYERDQRFHAICQAVVHDVLRRHPAFQNREGHDFAIDMAATIVERVFSDDAELKAQREQADRYRKLAEDTLALSPPRIFHPLAKPEKGG